MPPRKPTPAELIADAEAEALAESMGGLYFLPPDGEESAQPADDGTPSGPSLADRQKAKRILAEMANRRREGLRLYEPLPIVERFHADRRRERLLRGSNRAGKTLAAAVEVARAVTGQDPHGKFPTAEGRAAIVGLKGEHLAEVIYRKLFRPGAFKIIKDLETGEWRAFRPSTDRDRPKADVKPAPALIPKRFIKAIAWEEKKTFTPRRITLHNGWELTFYSSLGSPPNGIDIDLLWIDEEIQNEAWYPEMVARLLDRRGTAFWSATPQVASEHLFNLHIRAEDYPEDVGEHIALLEDNPHLDDDVKRLFIQQLSEEDRRVRIKGEFALTGFKIYPNFHMGVYGYDLEGPVPANWARFMTVDPGRQRCAVLFGAVSPPDHPPMLLIYDELYIPNCDADQFGRRVSEKIDAVQAEAFAIDHHAGRITEMGSGLTVEGQYAASLKKYDVRSATTGHGFLWGLDDVKAGILAVHEYMRIREDGRPTLMVAKGRCPHLEHEFVRYHYRKINKQVSDEPEKKNDHLMDCLRYLCGMRPRWTKPKPYRRQKGYAVDYMSRKVARKREKSADRPGGVRMGPGSR